ncbi:MAG: hypothetical protein F4206_16925 [Gammaproteobacteria bacterium]|nr:hypothetical protein [Gammaproteobacteria bacterium]
MNNKSGFLVAMVMLFIVPAEAIEISWYEQEEPGHADGEIRLTGLGFGDLVVTTPSRRLETAIMRLGDVAVVRLSESAGAESQAGDLMVVATQGTRTVRASFPLAMPVSSDVGKRPVPGANTANAISPEEVRQAPRSAGSPVADEPDQVVPVTVVVAPMDNSNPDSGASPVCSLLVVTPGSLYATVARLLAECGHELGNWDPGNEETIVDFDVSGMQTVENDAGIKGLLGLLHEYGLVGVVRPGTDMVDIYEL